MRSIKTILHPTDFSARAEAAFRFACALARDQAARLIVLHVSPPPSVIYGTGIVPPDPEWAEEEVRGQLDRMQSGDPKVPVEHLLVTGSDAAAEILRVAREIPCDLIVMGTHGRTGLSRVLLGSVVEEVVRKAPCPVLSLKLPFPQPMPAPEERSANVQAPASSRV